MTSDFVSGSKPSSRVGNERQKWGSTYDENYEYALGSGSIRFHSKSYHLVGSFRSEDTTDHEDALGGFRHLHSSFIPLFISSHPRYIAPRYRSSTITNRKTNPTFQKADVDTPEEDFDTNRKKNRGLLELDDDKDDREATNGILESTYHQGDDEDPMYVWQTRQSRLR